MQTHFIKKDSVDGVKYENTASYNLPVNKTYREIRLDLANIDIDQLQIKFILNADEIINVPASHFKRKALLDKFVDDANSVFIRLYNHHGIAELDRKYLNFPVAPNETLEMQFQLSARKSPSQDGLIPSINVITQVGIPRARLLTQTIKVIPANAGSDGGERTWLLPKTTGERIVSVEFQRPASDFTSFEIRNGSQIVSHFLPKHYNDMLKSFGKKVNTANFTLYPFATGNINDCIPTANPDGSPRELKFVFSTVSGGDIKPIVHSYRLANGTKEDPNEAVQNAIIKGAKEAVR